MGYFWPFFSYRRVIWIERRKAVASVFGISIQGWGKWEDGKIGYLVSKWSKEKSEDGRFEKTYLLSVPLCFGVRRFILFKRSAV